jgi:hypothetical protein
MEVVFNERAATAAISSSSQLPASSSKEKSGALETNNLRVAKE